MGDTKVNEGVVPVKCPCCGQRMFDMEKSEDRCVLSIKCAKCGTVWDVSMHHNKYRCRRRIGTRT